LDTLLFWKKIILPTRFRTEEGVTIGPKIISPSQKWYKREKVKEENPRNYTG
jgi:hypothetical protein